MRADEVHVMLDLETLGNTPGAVILSIGAVIFGQGNIYEEFSEHIKLEDSLAHGLKMDGDTVLWWLKQSQEAQEKILKGQDEATTLIDALFCFKRFALNRCQDDNKRLFVWGKGPSFDCALLAAAYRAAGSEVPWRYSNERCFRTVLAEHPEVPEPAWDGVKHDALDDAIHQAKHLMLMRPDL